MHTELNPLTLSPWKTSPTARATKALVTSCHQHSNGPSKGNTVILEVTDPFSHSIRLLPLHSLLSVFELAEILFIQVFRNFGLPEDIVSDRGPQFMHGVWSSFMEKLGVRVIFTSIYLIYSIYLLITTQIGPCFDPGLNTLRIHYATQ